MSAKADNEETIWTVDPSHTGVEFAVRHMMISTVKGHFTDVSGTVTVAGDDLAGGRAEVEVGIASVETREPARDTHLRSADFFDAERFPRMTFRSRKVERLGDEELRVTGDLTIRDVTRELVLDVTAEGWGKDPWGNERAGFTARGRLRRSDFGLTWNQALETGGVLVGDDVKIGIDVELIKQGS